MMTMLMPKHVLRIEARTFNPRDYRFKANKDDDDGDDTVAVTCLMILGHGDPYLFCLGML